MSYPKRLRLTYKTLNKNAKKYWRQRYSIFSKYDEGILMNQELWFSVTPEAIAIFIAKYLRSYYITDGYKTIEDDDFTIIDVFCGGGGNTIQLAKRFRNVIAIDSNKDNLFCCEHNCSVYGLNEHVQFMKDDWVTTNKQYFIDESVDTIFASPPWGGPGYKNSEIFDLNYLQPLPLKELLESFFQITYNVCLFLPRNSDVSQISTITRELLGEESKCKILYTSSNGLLKGMFVMFGCYASNPN